MGGLHAEQSVLVEYSGIQTATQTASSDGYRGLKADLEHAEPCTNHFLPVGYELVDRRTGKVIAVLGEDRKFAAVQ
jgi:hypothetical protein